MGEINPSLPSLTNGISYISLFTFAKVYVYLSAFDGIFSRLILILEFPTVIVLYSSAKLTINSFNLPLYNFCVPLILFVFTVITPEFKRSFIASC